MGVWQASWSGVSGQNGTNVQLANGMLQPVQPEPQGFADFSGANCMEGFVKQRYTEPGHICAVH